MDASHDLVIVRFLKGILRHARDELRTTAQPFRSDRLVSHVYRGTVNTRKGKESKRYLKYTRALGGRIFGEVDNLLFTV